MTTTPAPTVTQTPSASGSSADIILELKDLKKHFPVRGKNPLAGPIGWVRAVDGVSIALRRGETYSLVGESGCGKTTTARLVLLLERPTDGAIFYEGNNLARFHRPDLDFYRRGVQAVFQDPWSSMNPRMRVGEIIAEPLALCTDMPRKERAARVAELLVSVGLDPSVASNYPHEFSGGQRQRVAIARALALRPQVIVLDEPVSALDVSVSAQIMNLLRDLQASSGVSFLMISHNLASVRYLSHRVGVMYLGELVEEASCDEIFDQPKHPYTQALISSALPVRVPEPGEQPVILGGEVPSPSNPPAGCRFHTRCPFVMERCSVEAPAPTTTGPGHMVACHLYG